MRQMYSLALQGQIESSSLICEVGTKQWIKAKENPNLATFFKTQAVQRFGEVAAVLQETGVTAVFVSHDRDEVARLADRVAVLAGGRLRQVGPTPEVFSSPADETVAAYVGVETVTPARVLSSGDGIVVLQVGEAQVEAAADGFSAGEALFCLRPEDVVLAAGDVDVPSSARNRLRGTVRRVIPIGAEVRVELDCGFPLVSSITRRSLEELGLAVGSPLVASFKATAVHLIPRGG